MHTYLQEMFALIYNYWNMYLLIAIAFIPFFLIYWKYFKFCGTLIFLFYLSSFMSFFGRYFAFYNAKAWWSDHCRWFMNVSLNELPGSKPLFVTRENKAILLINHRSVADFFLHDCISLFRCSYLSRYLVAVLFPVLWVIVSIDNSVWFFNRGGRGRELEPFYKWIDSKFNSPFTVRRSLMVYPEGHRNYSMQPLNLKSGFIRYAYERKCKVQIVQAFGLEELMNDKTFEIDFSGKVINYYYDSPIDPSKFESQEEFDEHVRERFASTFAIARDLVYPK